MRYSLSGYICEIHMDMKIMLAVCLVVGLVVGGGGAYAVISGQSTSLVNEKTTLQQQLSEANTEKTSLEGQINTLTTEKTTLQATVTSLETQLATSTKEKTTLTTMIQNKNTEITRLDAEVEKLQTAYNKLQASSPRKINLDIFVSKLMAKRGEAWQQTQNNADIQVLIIIQKGESYYDSQTNDIKTAFIANGGAVAGTLRYSSSPELYQLEYLLASAEVKAVTDHYGLNHTAILVLGSHELYQIFTDAQNYPSNQSSQLPWIYPDPGYDDQFAYLLNAPWD